MRHLKQFQTGFSIIDMIIGISIIAIAILAIQVALSNYISMSTRVEVGLRAVSLGNSVMNTIRMHRYDENLSSPWSISYGTDAGESTSADYDDIDDYAGTSWDFSGDGFAGYTVTTRVHCVDLTTSWTDSVGPGTNFKRIIVSMDHDAMDHPMIFSSLMAGI
ncbi:MAG: hypothetical protein HOB84_11630 [Candidatus Marinimicrobia bacterium]|jgi:type II secretory pathway pseudopilin PulG|nr:hypothetical protein [Candidatus Neomarinimicrobiota bacterium]MBT4359396.1 hypothetical protein [Candidatus Neomarinimicrobiota bacterium]MBT4715412.1 hypothetical protein [Candidatus Neomarinimicrobiota bacterium]MBT4944558.1 hypothetical protein [Candidatus Neomarinimicrobiota bacterium]MBT5268824.1 hypothetical protein [Candidatus Neomarinimicrobiota bacterium]